MMTSERPNSRARSNKNISELLRRASAVKPINNFLYSGDTFLKNSLNEYLGRLILTSDEGLRIDVSEIRNVRMIARMPGIATRKNNWVYCVLPQAELSCLCSYRLFLFHLSAANRSPAGQMHYFPRRKGLKKVYPQKIFSEEAAVY